MIRRRLGARPAAWVAPLVPVLVGAAIIGATLADMFGADLVNPYRI